MTNKPFIFDLSTIELEQTLAGWGQPTYRAKQVEAWLYQNYADNASVMTNLPKSLRQKLTKCYQFKVIDPYMVVDSTDGQTRKILFKLMDGREVEAVLMRYEKRQTLCISTQAGCAMGCPFCATGQMGFIRNLTAGEIVAQVLHYARQLNEEARHVTNVVFMGMGEPLANYTETWQAIRRLNASSGFNLGARHMTVSTVGLVPAIRRMSKEPEQIGLAVSLHAPTDALRDTLIPINKRYPIAMLMETLRDYITITNRRITFEYALMDNLNDSDEQADQLVTLVKDMLCHINLIPLNPTPDSSWSGSSDERVYRFRDRLQAAGVPTTVRLRRGIDIAAGCGQLYNHAK
ncbi:23S rRNA (adenine(2503)-C(2))-methyltransferase RlmN [Anaerolineales bacterium HSG24]|nr:23S rRNA (adenine(2503)-C(2))-methyltransferase RlmN [Anaerolineales bacterium HSG24]